MGVTANGHRVSLWGDEMFGNWIEVMVVQHCESTNATELHVFEWLICYATFTSILKIKVSVVC